MIPTELTLRNFMCYREDTNGAALTLPFDGLHVVCLSGENGAGKSALLDAITWALWGRARTADDDLIAQGASEMVVELTFQLGDQRYRVARRRQRGRTGPRGGQSAGKGALDLHVFAGATWKPIAEATIRETQDRINDLLRMSYDTFINASFLLQGRADEFTARTPSERKQVLADILDLSVYTRLEERAKVRARAADDQSKGLRGRIENIAQQAEQAPFWREKVAEAEQRITALQTQITALQAHAHEIEAQLRALDTQASERKATLLRLSELQAEQQRRINEITLVQERITAAAALVARRDAIAAGVHALQAAQAERERLEEVRGRYFQLDQERASLKQALRDALNELRLQEAAAQQRLTQLHQHAEQRTTLASAIASGEALLVNLRPLTLERNQCQERLTGYEQQLNWLQDRQQALQRLETQLEQRRAALLTTQQTHQQRSAQLERQLADAPRWEIEFAAAQHAQHELETQSAQLAQLRAQIQIYATEVGDQRALCRQLQEQADALKQRQAMLGTGTETCPICLTPLGAEGQHRVADHYATELQALRERYANARTQAEQCEAQAQAAQAELSTAEVAVNKLRQQAASADLLQHQLAQAKTWRSEWEAAQAELHILADQLAANAIDPPLQAEYAALQAEVANLGDLASLTHERQMLLERIRELDAELRQLDQIEGKLSAQRDALAAADLALAELPAAETTLAALTQQISSNDFAHPIRQRGREVEAAMNELAYSDAAYTAIKATIQELSHWDAEQRELVLAESRLSADQTILAQHQALQQTTSAELVRLEAHAAALQTALHVLPQVQAQAHEIARQLQSLAAEQHSAQNDLGMKRGYLHTAEGALRELSVAQAELHTIETRRSLFAELAEACGKKGVQAMLIESAIPQIEDEANRLLARMTDNQMHLSLETQSETKKGDTVETLEIKIADALGTRVYDAFSGGEALRANFAVRIALSRLLARRAGARLETLVIDEGFGALDAIGRERMVEAITSVQTDFQRIIVITHIDELKDRFPATIEVSKTPLGSYWELR
jgi:exonuclease SbcC